MSIMKYPSLFRGLVAVAALLATIGAQAASGVAERLVRTKAAGIDILIYPMDVKDVVTVVASMPLGDAVVASRKTNPAVPTLTTHLLESGTTRKTKFQISDMLARKGATLEISSNAHMVLAHGRSLRADLGMVTQLLADELRTPAFAPAELTKAKADARAELQMELDDPESVASEALNLALYPASSTNGVVPNAQMAKAIDKVTVADVRAFHKRYFGPAHMTLIFTGDVDSKEAERLVNAAFGGWTGGVALRREAGQQLTPSVLSKDLPLADKAAVSVLWAVPTGLMQGDADALPLELGTRVLGSGFTSRLLGTVRDKEGLTYGINANAAAGDLDGGRFAVSTSFAPELMERGIASTRRELDKWYRDGVTAQELQQRKTAAIGLQRLAMGSTTGMASALLSTVLRGQPVSMIDTYPDRINAVTLEQVNAAIRKYGDPSKLMMVRAGTFPGK